jgi:transcriptional regulator with XRE-family HTH domain
MNFSEKLQEFFTGKGLKQKRDIAKAMDSNEQVVGRWMKSDKPTALLLERLKQYFPDAPLAYLLSDDNDTNNVLQEPSDSYSTEAVQLVVEIEERLNKLKEILAQICHNK